MKATVVLKSYCPVTKSTVTTMLLEYPRRIHAEMMTYRMWGRNGKSSRAVPVKKYIEEAEFNPAVPIHWGKAQKGMQAREELTGEERALVQAIWHESRFDAINAAKRMLSQHAAKQLVNRVLEPYISMSLLVTATEWNNFFYQRCHEDADPEIQRIADLALVAYLQAPVQELNPTQWHIPFGDQFIDPSLPLGDKLRISAARCARLSYMNFDGDFSPEKDYTLFENLVESGHWTPLEHACVATDTSRFFAHLRGFRSLRDYYETTYKKNVERLDLITLAKQRGLL